MGGGAAHTLPPAADAAWHAYRAMLASKQAHFAELERLGLKRQRGETVTLAETARLGGLLERHDACVTAFRREMQALGECDAAARHALLAAIAEINADLGGPAPPPSS